MTKSTIFALLTYIVCFLGSTSIYGQGFLKTSGKKIVNERGENVLLRGMGLGGWMLQEGYMLKVNKESQQYRIRERMEVLIGKKATDSFYEAWLENFITRTDIDSLHAWGFNSVRLPLHYNLFMPTDGQEPVPGDNPWLETGFRFTDSLIRWCKSNQMYVILDLHAAPGGQGNDLNISDRSSSKPSLWQSKLNQEKTLALWKKLAERYVGESTVGAYDIINEPNWGFEDTLNDRNGLQEKKNIPLKELLMEITKTIRTVDQKHIIVIEGNGWGNNYRGILPPWDDNMVLSFHKYWNYNDKQSIQHILDYREQYNIPVWLGETGENSNTWFTDAIVLLESHNIGWSWWPLKKLGNNNPLQIVSNPDYDAIVNYWNGDSTKVPERSVAYRGLMQLVQNTKAEKNLFHRDVVDAMFRQTHDYNLVPFKSGQQVSILKIDAVDYDLGRNGFAYYDLDTGNYWTSGSKERGGNLGRLYRNDGVDIYYTGGEKGFYYVGDFQDSEWLKYSVDIPEQGKYDLEILISADKEPGILSISEEKKNLSQKIQIPVTRGDWETITLKNLPLEKGYHQFKLKAEKGGFLFASILFRKK